MNGLRRNDPLRDPEPLIRRVYSYVAYRIGDGPEAEDVTSEVFERALRYRRSFDPRKGEPIAWLLGIAHRCIHSSRASEPHLSLDEWDAAGPDDLQSRSIDRVTLGSAIERLGERDRELIALRYGGDLTAAQIGDVLGLRTNAVEVALHRALDRLRTALEAEPEPRQVPALAHAEEG
jgi:RNA polymerase sigma-70 factor (ECF subfamily)